MDQRVGAGHELREQEAIGDGSEQMNMRIIADMTHDPPSIAAVADEHEANRAMLRCGKAGVDDQRPALLGAVAADADEEARIFGKRAAREKVAAKIDVAMRR